MKSCIPLTSFVHNSINAVEGQALEIDDGLALDLERAGLVRVRFEPPVNIPAAPGKVLDDGAGQPSSASPPAPALRLQTSPKSKRGVEKTRKKGR